MSNSKLNTKAICEVGLTLAIIVVIMLLMAPVPILDRIGIMILPVPITIIYLRYSNKIAVITVLASVLLVSILLGPIIAVPAALTYGLTGITLGYCIKKNKKVAATLILLACASLVSIVCNTILYLTFIESIGFIDFLNNYVVVMKEQFSAVKDLYMSMGIKEEQLAIFNMLQEALTIKNVLIMIPGSIVLAVLVIVSLNYTIARSILIKLGYKTIEPLSFSNFYITNLLGALLIALISIGIILNAKGFAIGEYIQYSMVVIANTLLVINGMAAVTYYFRKKRNMSKVVVFLILFFSLYLKAQMIYFYIGFVEMIFDFRKLDPYRITIRKKSGV